MAVNVLTPVYINFSVPGFAELSPQRLANFTLIILLMLEFVFRMNRPARNLRRISYMTIEFACVIVFFSWLGFSALVQLPDPEPLSAFLRSEFSTNVLVLVGTITYIRGPADITWFQKLIVSVAIIVCTFAIYEAYQRSNFLFQFANLEDKDIRFAIMDKTRDLAYRAQGPFTHPLLLADFAWMSALTAACLFFKLRSLAAKILIVLAISVILIAGKATSTRTGLILPGAAVTVVFGMWHYSNIFRFRAPLFVNVFVFMIIFLFLTVIAIAIILPVLETVLFGRTMEEYLSSVGRLTILERGLDSLSDSPLFGYGFLRGIYHGAIPVGTGVTLDNYFLLTGLNAGAPAMLALLVLHLSLVIKNLASVLRDDDAKIDHIFIIGIALFCLISKSLHALIDLHFMFFLALGIHIAMAAQRRSHFGRGMTPFHVATR